MKKLFKGIAIFLLLLLLVSWFVGAAWWAGDPPVNEPVATARPVLETTSRNQKQILYGDLHTHTSYSMDAAIFGTPLVKNTGYVTPADACDFARFCSALDFWSINDHAEGLAPWQWRATKTAIRQCNAGSPADNPDMVAFLGWEWSQGSKIPATHYGHKNVILRDTEEGAVPLRPIASAGGPWRGLGQIPSPLRGLGLLAASKVVGLGDYDTLAGHMQAMGQTPDCADGDVRDLPEDCFEVAAEPRQLFDKLDQWGFPALVIPHGLSWGTTNPVGADFASQMDQHDPRYQRLLEVYSGHGNSEVYRPLPVTLPGADVCGEPVDGYTPCCWQAGEIIRQRCEKQESGDCDASAKQARQYYLAANAGGVLSNARNVVADTSPNDWGQCDQLTSSFEPANDYQPRNSAQYILSLGDNSHRAEPKRARLGLMASSDNHTGRAGSGYKEFARFYMTDTKDLPAVGKLPVYHPSAEPVDATDLGLLSGLSAGGGKNAFYYTGGLVAVHSEGRDRQSIWDALQRREVYGTSGPRISLWFDLIDRQGVAHPMGSELWGAGKLKFRVRAMGSQKQLPGCPDYANAALGEEGIERLCRGECYNPDDSRYTIQRIEVVRILPQFNDHEGPDQEKTAELIQDPWLSFECEAGTDSCEVEFEDTEFGGLGREAVYYVRAIQEPTETVNGDPFRCDYDAEGNCVQTHYCLGVAKDMDCLSPAAHRAWSSPIFVQFAGE